MCCGFYEPGKIPIGKRNRNVTQGVTARRGDQSLRFIPSGSSSTGGHYPLARV